MLELRRLCLIEIADQRAVFVVQNEEGGGRIGGIEGLLATTLRTLLDR